MNFNGLFLHYKSIFSLIGKKRRIHFLLILFLMILTALFEVISIGALVPFIGILISPSHILENKQIINIFSFFGITEKDNIILLLTLLFVFAAIFSGAIRILLVWSNARFSFGTGAELGRKILEKTLNEPYISHLGKNSSEIISGITKKIDLFVQGGLLASLIILSSAISLLFILFALFAINWKIALSSIIILLGFYIVIILVVRGRIKKNAIFISINLNKIFQSIQESLFNLKEIILYNSQDFFVDSFKKLDTPMRSAQGNNLFLSQFPRYVLEIFAITSIALIAYILTISNDTVNMSILPTLAAFALGGQKILPAIQQGYSAWSTIIGTMPSVKDAVQLLKKENFKNEEIINKLEFKKSVVLKNISFTFSSGKSKVLDSLDLKITKGDKIGIVGTTGSGKSTLIDIILGLLKPDTGTIEVDGKRIENSNVKNWQKNIAYVPQEPFLIDASFLENIAFGVDPKEVDMKNLIDASKVSCILDFINSKENGFKFKIGENGSLLSGGQKQRLAISRALYRKTNTLILDEASSALDKKTEIQLLNNLILLNAKITVILITHKLESLKKFNKIFEIKNGSIIKLK